MTVSETFGRTIQLFLVDGTPNGLRKAMVFSFEEVRFQPENESQYSEPVDYVS